MTRVLVIDDEIEIGSFFKRLLERRGYTVYISYDGSEISTYLDTWDFHLALVDLKLPNTSGLDILENIKAVQPYCEVIIMTGYSTTRTAVKAIQLGAFDYIEKPFDDIAQIEILIQKALEYGCQNSGGEEGQPEWFNAAFRLGLQVGSSQKMRRLVALAHKIAGKNINVLIQGETGTGKEVLARFIHGCSNRADNTFIPINCGAFQESLLESELFGHEKGAFTGASGLHKGIFEIANGGTLFLDEIAESSSSIQVKLLRILETGEFFRVGGEKAITTDVRVIAASNVDLCQAVTEKIFREDLFYRLDVIRLEIPPLRERKEDIPMLVNYFLRQSGAEESIQVSPEAMQILQEYSWPGNVREVLNAIDQALAMVENNIIMPDCLSNKILYEVRGIGKDSIAGSKEFNSKNIVNGLKKILSSQDNWDELSEEELLTAYKLAEKLKDKIKDFMNQKGIDGPPPPTLEEVEKKIIKETLNYYRGNISNAARSLGVGRNTFYRKLSKYEISYK